MAVKAKTFNQAKAIHNTNSELAWWVFMRVSGLILVFLVFGHVYFNNIAFNAGNIDYAYVAERISKPWIKVYDSFLLGFALLHGVNGLRYSVEDYVRKPGRRFWAKVALYTVAGIMLVIGVITLWSFTFDDMGDAIRALPADH